jgi:hypothetical protein
MAKYDLHEAQLTEPEAQVTKAQLVLFMFMWHASNTLESIFVLFSLFLICIYKLFRKLWRERESVPMCGQVLYSRQVCL